MEKSEKNEKGYLFIITAQYGHHSGIHCLSAYPIHAQESINAIEEDKMK